MHLLIALRDHARQIVDAVAAAARHVGAWVARTAAAVWRRHQDLMADRPTYRAELLAAGTALLALVDPPAALISAATSLLGLYVASYGIRPENRPQPVVNTGRVDSDWPPAPPRTRLWEQDWD